MMLWIAFAVLAALALVVLLRPLLASAPRVEGGDDAEVYAAQLEEVEADLARGLISEADAEAARTEIARRLLRAHRSGRTAARMRRRDTVTAGLVAVFVPLFSVGAYLAIGAPDYGDQPLAARTAPMSEEDLARLLARAEDRLADDPQDVEGWATVAPIYQRLGRYREAADAFGQVNALAGESADYLIAQAESLVLDAGGQVTDEAWDLFERANELAPQNVTPAIFLAGAARQRGNYDEAAERWRVLLRQSEGDEAWLQIAAAEFTMMSGAGDRISPDLSPPGMSPPGASPSPDGPGAAPPSAAAPAPGPTADQVRAAAAMDPSAREAMIEGMVEGLARRLEADGGTAQEWLRLVRSYKALGREGEAREAVEAALEALPQDERTALEGAAEVRALLQDQ